MMSPPSNGPMNKRRKRQRMLMACAAVALVHLGLFTVLGRMGVHIEVTSFAPTIMVQLEPQPIIEPPLPDAMPTPQRGGGAPKAPSVVHLPKLASPQQKPEVVAPPEPAPEQPLLVGRSETGIESSSQGQGGVGNGTGRGIGDGDGDGRGQGPRLVRGPTRAELRQVHPPVAFRKRQGGQASLNCKIRLDRRLEDCVVVEESPAGMGFGQAALAAAAYFRFEPPVRAGSPVSGTSVRVGVQWP